MQTELETTHYIQEFMEYSLSVEITINSFWVTTERNIRQVENMNDTVISRFQNV